MRNYPKRINKTDMLYYSYSFKTYREVSDNLYFGWLLKDPQPIYDESRDDRFFENYSYTLIDTDTIIGYVHKNYKSEFFSKILHKKNTGWYKRLVCNKSTMATKYLCQLQLCVNEDTLYKRIMNDDIYLCEKEFIYYYLCEKTNSIEYLKDDWKKNWTTENDLSTQPDNFNVKLFEYQLRSLKWMLNIEKDETNNKFYPYISMKHLTDHENISKLNFDIFDRLFVFGDHKVHKLLSSGGILADEIGLGKTLTSIALICKNPCVIKPNIELGSLSIKLTKDNKICTGTTLIICPSHLTKQWETEILKTCPNLRLAVIMTKTHHKKYTYLDLLDIDVMVVSLDFFTNVKWYVNIENYLNPPKKYSYTGMDGKLTSTRMAKGFEYRLRHIQQEFRYKVSPVEFVPNVHTYLLKNIFRFENMHWYRVMVDEGHENFKTNYDVDDDYCDVKKLYQLKFLNALSSKYKWCISGTPFYDKLGLKQTLEFLNFKSTKQIKVNRKNVTVNLNFDEIVNEGVILKNLTSSIYKQIYIRNTMESVKDTLNIPPAIIETIFLNFSTFEQVLYDSIKRTRSQMYLRKMCCNIQINDKFSSIDNFSVFNFDEVKKKIIHETEAKIGNLKKKLLKLNKEDEFEIKKLTNEIGSNEFILKTFEKQTIKDIEKEICPICKCNFEDPIVTNCGHNFCYDCITSLLNIDSYKNECPICRNKIYRSTIYKLNKDNNKLDKLVYKYGTKLAKLIKLTKQILTDKKNSIIIFSQWDMLLTMIGSVLKSNGINNVFCKGNIHQQNSSITAFRKKTKRVIMLSTENAASGTNLTEATHIIFMEPIKGDKDDIMSMENQAIGRAVRIGQKNQV